MLLATARVHQSLSHPVLHLRRNPEQSLGVVTFNIAQADTIENHLEQFRRQKPELERYFAPDRLEKSFVKNLESVQGDERDVLIFSVGYGKDKFGRLTLRIIRELQDISGKRYVSPYGVARICFGASVYSREHLRVCAHQPRCYA